MIDFMYRFRELREQFGLPRVGERVRNKDTDTVWKVIEEKEDWSPESGGDNQSRQLIPAVYIRYWKEDGDSQPGRGKTDY